MLYQPLALWTNTPAHGDARGAQVEIRMNSLPCHAVVSEKAERFFFSHDWNIQMAISSSTTTEKARSKQLKQVGLLVLLAFIFLVLIRLPFLVNPINGEEGFQALMAVDNDRGEIEDVSSPILVSRVNGFKHWTPPFHPIVPYWTFVKLLRPLTSPVEFDSLSLNEKTVLARVPFFLLFCIALIAPFIMAGWLRKEDSPATLYLTLAILLFIGCSRPLMQGSIQPQQDGSFGVMVVGWATMCLWLASRRGDTLSGWILAFLAGILSALGKQEWALALLAAAVLTVVVIALVPRIFPSLEKPAGGPGLRVAAAVVLGLICGSGFNIQLDPENYFGGFRVMEHFTANSPGWFEVNQRRLPRLYHLALLIPLALLIVWREKEKYLCKNPALLLAFLYATGLLGGFLLTSWSTSTRYFCPGYFALLCFLLIAVKDVKFAPRTGQILIILFLIFFVVDILGSLKRCDTLDIGSKERRELEYGLAKTKDPGLAPVVGSEVAYYYPDADFINSSSFDGSAEGMRRARIYYEERLKKSKERGK